MLLGQKILLYHICNFNVINFLGMIFFFLMLLEITREGPQSPVVCVFVGRVSKCASGGWQDL